MERERAFLCVLVGCVDAIICACLWLWEEEEKEREEEKVKEWQRERDRQRRSGWRIVAWCAALQRDNRMPARLAYLCCTPHSCFCCLPLPAKSHPAATWGRRSTPPGPCSSSSGRGQITNTNHLLILVIKETLITSELRSSAALNDHKEAISETIQRATQVQHNPFFSLFFLHCWENVKSGQFLWVYVCVRDGQQTNAALGVMANGCKSPHCICFIQDSTRRSRIRSTRLNKTSHVSENHKKNERKKGEKKDGDFQREGSKCSAVNFGRIVPRYHQDLTISWNKQGRI